MLQNPDDIWQKLCRVRAGDASNCWHESGLCDGEGNKNKNYCDGIDNTIPASLWMNGCKPAEDGQTCVPAGVCPNLDDETMCKSQLACSWSSMDVKCKDADWAVQLCGNGPGWCNEWDGVVNTTICQTSAAGIKGLTCSGIYPGERLDCSQSSLKDCSSSGCCWDSQSAECYHPVAWH